MGKKLEDIQTTFYFCDGESCRKNGSESAIREARAYLRNTGQWDDNHSIKTRCNGRCENGPTWIVQPGNHWYKDVNASNAIEIVKAHVEQNQPLESELLYKDGWNATTCEKNKPESFIKPFELFEETDGSNWWRTRGLSSDQRLYPLFKKWLGDLGDSTSDYKLDTQKDKESANAGSFTSQSGKTHHHSQLIKVEYTDPQFIELQFKTDTERVMVGACEKNSPENLLKIRKTYYAISEDLSEMQITFENYLGEFLGKLCFSNEDFWKYCLEIQLDGMKMEVPVV